MLFRSDAAIFDILQKKYISYIDLSVSDTLTGKTAIKRVMVWIYPAFHPVDLSLQYQRIDFLETGSGPSEIPNPYYDESMDQWFFLSDSLNETLIFDYVFDNHANEPEPNLENAHLYGLTQINLYQDSVANPDNPLFNLGVSAGSESSLTATAGSTSYSLNGTGVYDLAMTASIANGLVTSKTVRLKALDGFEPIHANPRITSISMAGQSVQTDLPADGTYLELMGEQAIIRIELNGLNPNGGGLNYFGLSSSANVQASFEGSSSNGIISAVLAMPDETQAAAIHVSLADALGRNSWTAGVENLDLTINLTIRRKHTKPLITIVPDSVVLKEQSFLEFRYDLNDPDGDLNDVRLLFSIFGSDNPFIQPTNVQGELSVREEIGRAHV